jgi:polyphosphate kinase
MHRNLDRRVEVLLRVCDDTAARQLQDVFDAAMADGVRCWELGSDGAWARTGECDYQAELMAAAVDHAG